MKVVIAEEEGHSVKSIKKKRNLIPLFNETPFENDSLIYVCIWMLMTTITNRKTMCIQMIRWVVKEGKKYQKGLQIWHPLLSIILVFPIFILLIVISMIIN